MSDPACIRLPWHVAAVEDDPHTSTARAAAW